MHVICQLNVPSGAGTASWHATKDCGGGTDQNNSLAKTEAQLPYSTDIFPYYM